MTKFLKVRFILESCYKWQGSLVPLRHTQTWREWGVYKWNHQHGYYWEMKYCIAYDLMPTNPKCKHLKKIEEYKIAISNGIYSGGKW